LVSGPGPRRYYAGSPDGLTPAEQLARIAEAVGVLASDQKRWRELRGTLAEHGTCWSTAGGEQEGEDLQRLLLRQIFRC
jgi:hypothetical protein